MTAQAKYEEEEFDALEQAKEYQRQGHTFECSYSMVRGSECICEMEGWRKRTAEMESWREGWEWKRSEQADKIINFMRREG